MSLKINAFLRQNPISSLRVYVRFDLIVLKDKAKPTITLLPPQGNRASSNDEEAVQNVFLLEETSKH